MVLVLLSELKSQYISEKKNLYRKRCVNCGKFTWIFLNILLSETITARSSIKKRSLFDRTSR